MSHRHGYKRNLRPITTTKLFYLHPSAKYRASTSITLWLSFPLPVVRVICSLPETEETGPNCGRMVCELTAKYRSLKSMPETETEAGAEQEEDPEEGCISCTTFNILAPIYKRLDQHGQNQGLRESEFRAFWRCRNQGILDWLLHESSSVVICLQEFWVGNDELVHMYQERLGYAGYVTFQLARTNNRGDGLLTAIHKDYLRVLDYRELLFNGFGDRVAQLFHVESVVPFLQNHEGNALQEILIVNTHLLFPHVSSLSLVRLRQVFEILQYVESYQKEKKLKPIPIILCGDWNGSKRGHVYKFLRSQGFVSSYDTAHEYTDSDADAHKWVSHRNHRGNICGVDFIWLCNPNKALKPLRTSWAEAVFGIIKGDNHVDFIKFSNFCEALRQVNLIGLPCGLSFPEIKDLWAQADINGDGVVDYEEFKKIWNPTWSGQTEENLETSVEELKQSTTKEAIGFKVKNAVLFPREVEKGMWPENYSLSDHAPLTVVFSPVSLSNNHT
ncbi:uncharacterized calcium-binding protein At1g02270-like isoform X2 [Alnus glutinosa]|uniref:uncharacterized calcium-binding protein At1g02270-like isoform X2 n=1 Tax=Alnus glutinosa TaxID=3517 RepID=UPI002D77F73B|nr:uncharacterized calcium-binding protein At1g02270-like isoform X2 [Alnus glutinosa]